MRSTSLLLAAACLAGTCVAQQFSINLNANGQEVSLQHFEGADPAEEARAFCATHSLDAEQFVPQLVGLITERLSAAPPQQATPVFAIALNANGQEVSLQHFEGADPAEEARAFCAEHGLDPAQHAGALQRMIVQRLGEQQQGQPQQGQPDQSPAQAGEPAPLFELPLNLNGREVMLPFFEGQTALEATLKFCQAHGLGAEPNLKQYIDQIQGMVQARLAEMQAQLAGQAGAGAGAGGDAGAGGTTADAITPLFSLPITLNETLHDLVYYEGQVPREAARDFCGAKWSAIGNGRLDEQAAQVELAECTAFLEETIVAVRSRLLDEDVADAPEDAGADAAAAAAQGVAAEVAA